MGRSVFKKSFRLNIIFEHYHILTRCLYLHIVQAVQLIAYISQHGLHGEISFKPHPDQLGKVRIQTDLDATLQYPDQTWNWALHQLPVDYSDMDPSRRCSSERLGKQLISFDEQLGLLTMPGNESVQWDADFALSGKLPKYIVS